MFVDLLCAWLCSKDSIVKTFGPEVISTEKMLLVPLFADEVVRGNVQATSQVYTGSGWPG